MKQQEIQQMEEYTHGTKKQEQPQVVQERYMEFMTQVVNPSKLR